MENLSKSNQNLIDAYNKGYRIVNGLIHYNGKITSPKIVDNNGYYVIGVRDSNNKRYNIYIHRLVGYQKYGEMIFNKQLQVRHLNGNNKDNLEDNIAIGTPQDNAMDIPSKVRK